MKTELGLTEVIRKIRQELFELYNERQENGQAPLFRIDTCELELNVISRIESKAGGKVSFGIFVTNIEGDYSKEKVHKLKLSLVPISSRVSEETLDVPTFLRRGNDISESEKKKKWWKR